ncbi:MAG: AAA family ATPase [Gemmatimonadota bacterium]
MPRPEIVVLAGTNGAGKSSVAGRALRAQGADYFNADEVTRSLLNNDASLSPQEANSRAWYKGRDMLRESIASRQSFRFETTLGGNSIRDLLLKAANVGIAVRVFYVALESPELHIERVQARVDRGGHHIPEDKIRARYDRSRQNLVQLLPHIAELRLYDNSKPVERGSAPTPLHILHVRSGRIDFLCPLHQVPGWAKPVVQRALELFGGGESGG